MNMSFSSQLSPEQLMSVIQTQTAIAKLGPDLNAVMTQVAEQAQRMTNAQGVVVELAEKQDMVYRAVAGTASNLLGLRLKKAHSLSGLCVEKNHILYCADSEIDDRVDREACRRVGLRSMAVVPLMHGNEAVGALKIYSEKPNAFHERDLQLLNLMSELIAAAMYHATKLDVHQLYRLATRDSLTGLANRALFLDCLRQGVLRAQQHHKSLAIMMIDMDGLKQINDNYGHRTGDAALKEMARRIQQSTREIDLTARLGGDEFAVILRDLPDGELAEMAVRRIADACKVPFIFENLELNITASIGLALFPLHGKDIDHLVEFADQQMYLEKRQRKDNTLLSK